MAPLEKPKRKIIVEPLPEPERRPRVVPPSRRVAPAPQRAPEPTKPEPERVPA
jgi:hypothetical protein